MLNRTSTRIPAKTITQLPTRMIRPLLAWRRSPMDLALAAVPCAAALLSGCVAIFGGAALGGAVIATDRRSTGIQLEDANIEHRINSALSDRFARESVRIDVTSYNQKVLLAGKVPSEKDRSDAENIARTSENVRAVVDELRIGSLAGLSGTGDDTLLAAKVRAALLEAHGVPTGALKTSCTDGTIYLFGLVNRAEADAAKKAASQVSGVKRVVAAFDLLPDTSAAPVTRSAQGSVSSATDSRAN